MCSGFQLNKKSIWHIGFFGKSPLTMRQRMLKLALLRLAFSNKRVTTVPWEKSGPVILSAVTQSLKLS